MAVHPLNLLKVQRFLPLFLTQFFGAFNDNFYKNALVILITYQLANELKLSADILITIAAGIFILPFLLFSAMAGQLADKYEKARLITYTKIIELLLMIIAALGFYLHSVNLLMLVLFLLGTQATFFGPLKYSILPDHLKPEELIAGNAWIEMGTFLAILLGTITGGVLVQLETGLFWVSVAGLLFALIGFVASLWIPLAKPAMPHLSVSMNIFRVTFSIIQHTRKKPEVFLSILGISWFWLVGATYVSQFPTYAKDILHARSSVVTLFLTVFSIGVGIGALLCNRLFRGKVTPGFVPMAAIGISLFSLDLVIATYYAAVGRPYHLMTLLGFLSSFSNWRIVFDLLMASICGGIYIVPLYVIVQQRSDPGHRSRSIAVNNILNSLFMVMAAVVTSLMLAIHFTVPQVFLLVALLNIGAALYMVRLKKLM